MKRKIKFSATDFLELQLPQTRKDQFFFILKNQYWTLFLLGLILMLSLLPIIINVYFKNFFENGFYDLYASGNISKAEYDSAFLYLTIGSSGISTILLSVFAISLSGANRIIKLMVYGEGVVFKEDFKLGIKQNYLNTFLICFFFGIILTIVRFLSTFFLEYLIGIPLYIFLAIVVAPIFIIALIFTSIYEANVFQCINNAAKLFVHYWWQFILLSIVPLGSIYALSLLGSTTYILSLIQIVLAVFVLPIYLLLLYEISNSMFDKYINKDNFEDNYMKGLYKPSNEKE
ncbi:MAG: hypothetical protein J6M95_01585 [Bacilli bacterium]|nr:hypothetical protein [Bacilli bacterium]